MTDDDLLRQLRNLEVALHQPNVHSDMARLDALLHDSFTEVGRSGRSYCKADILRELPLEKRPETIWSQDFSVVEMADGIALLTYRSANLNEKGEISRHTLRASLWQRTEWGWQMRFHQGTPTGVFTKKSE